MKNGLESWVTYMLRTYMMLSPTKADKEKMYQKRKCYHNDKWKDNIYITSERWSNGDFMFLSCTFRINPVVHMLSRSSMSTQFWLCVGSAKQNLKPRFPFFLTSLESVGQFVAVQPGKKIFNF